LSTAHTPGRFSLSSQQQQQKKKISPDIK